MNGKQLARKRVINLPEKPIPPKKEKIGISPYIIALLLSIVTSFIIVFYSKGIKERSLYNADLLEYKQIVANHSSDVARYNSETLSYIHSIDPMYDIDRNGTIPVIATVRYQQDQKSQYIGSEFSYNFQINDYNIRKEKEFRLNIFREVVFNTKIVESDPSSDDVGIEKTSVPISFLELNDGYTHRQVVRIREYYGKDAGNVAIYNVTYSIKPKQSLRLSAAQRASFPKYPILPNEPKKDSYSISFWDTIRDYTDVKLFIGIAFIFWISCSYNSLIRKPRIQYQRALDKYNKANEEYTSARNDLIQQLSGKTIRELAKVPDFVFFTDDDLPYTKGDDRKYGAFTLYVTPSGSCFHRERLCRKSAFPIHMFKISSRYIPCSICAKNYKIQKPTWYIEYLDLKNKCRHFEITE